MDLYNDINDKIIELNSSVSGLKTTGRNYAEAYRRYRILLAKELLRLKQEGMPVTIAYDIARGQEEVANAKYDELNTEAIYRSNLEGIQAIKTQLRVLENQYDKEYFTPERD